MGDNDDIPTLEVFPKEWKGAVLSSKEVWGKVPKQVTKSMLNHPNWSRDRLQELIQEKGKAIDEAWNIEESSYHLLLWQKNEDKECLLPPDAIMAFYPVAYKMESEDKIKDITLHNNLIWVTPEKRRQGLGRHLIAHLFHYLTACKLEYSLFSKKGVTVIYDAEYYTIEGKRISKYIISRFKLMRDLWKYEKVCALWPIKRVDVHANF